MSPEARLSIACAARWPVIDMPMSCPEPDGSLSPACRSLLDALPPASAPEGVSAEALALGTGLPLYRVRSLLGEAGGAGLVVDQGGLFRRTEAGDRLLAST